MRSVQLGRSTVADLERVPDDGMRYEILDGGDGPCPDVLVFQPGDYSLAVPVAAVALVVEVTSPRSRCNDTVTKLDRYARAGIPQYWIVDPDRIAVYELPHGSDRYREVQAGRHVQVTAPFPVDAPPG